MITRARLDAYFGKPMRDICPRGYADVQDNHCAHFVSHALAFRFGYTCGNMTNTTGTPASIRVQEVFHQCPVVGKWEDKPIVLVQCLVFITNANNVKIADRTMENVPRKHVGILCDGMIWHYSNSQSQVVKQMPEQFKNHYSAPSNSMFYGQIPWVPVL